MNRLLLLALAALMLGLPIRADETKTTPKFDTYDVVYLSDARPVLMRLHVSVDGKALSVMHDEYLASIFAFLDVNKDGSLDKDEAMGIPQAASLLNSNAFFFGRGVPPPPFNQIDTNNDGKVSKEELAAWYRKSGLAAFQVGNPVSPVRGFGGAALVLAGGAGTPNKDAVNEALFKLLDTNGDGKLSKAELSAAPDLLMKLDKNDDEIVGSDEIAPGRGPAGPPGAVVFDPATGRVLGNESTPFVLVTPDGGAELARRLQAHYGDKKIPQPNMRKVTRKEIGLDEATFKALDADGDGNLDAEELARFGKRTPDLELKVRLGEDRVVELADKKAPLANKIQQGVGKNDLRLEFENIRLDLKSLVTANTDNGRPGRPELRQQIVRQFKAAIGDNAHLDMNAAMQNPLFRNIFKLMDRDGDGKVTEKELLAYLDSFEALQANAQKTCASLGVSSEGKGLFEMMDTNGDGRLSLREMRNAVKLLGEFDKDGDGCLAQKEIPRTAVAGFRMGPSDSGNNLNARFVVAFPGGRNPPPQPPPAPRGPSWFVKMDRNADGDVSRREFIGTDEQFKAIDTDGDGLISVDEAEAFDKKARDKK